MNYPVGDFLIRVKNAAMAKNTKVSFVPNKKVTAVAEALKKMGYLDKVMTDSVTLAYKDKRPVLMDLKLVSKPGLRVYISTKEIEARRGPSVLLISTAKGVISSKQALKDRIGGEAIAEIV